MPFSLFARYCLTGLVVAGLAIPSICAGQPYAQERLPEHWKLIIETPAATHAWQALRDSPIRRLLLDTSGVDPLVAGLYDELGGLVDDGRAQYVYLPGPDPVANSHHLFLLETRNSDAVRELVLKFEKALIDNGASPRNTLTRLEESIGTARLRILTDGQDEAAFLLSPEHGMAAFSTHPDGLRALARRLYDSSDAPSPSSANAWPSPDTLFAPEHRPPHIRLFQPPRRSEETAVADPGQPLVQLLDKIAPRSHYAGGIRIEEHRLFFHTLAAVDPDDTSLGVHARESIVPLETLPGAVFTQRQPVWAAAGRLNITAIRRFFLAAVESARADFPTGDRTDLAPASSMARSRLDALGEWLSKTETLDPLGPDWFIALNRLEFRESEPLPQLDFVCGILTSDPANTLQAVLRLEAALEAGSGIPIFAETRLSVNESGDEPLFARQMASQRLPENLRFAWMVVDGWLLAGSSVEALTAAIARRRNTDSGEDFTSTLADIRQRLRVPAIHAYQYARPAPAAEHLAAVAAAWVVRRQKMAGVAPLPGSETDTLAISAAIVEILAKMDSLAIVQQNRVNDIHTAGEVFLNLKPDAATNESTTSSQTTEPASPSP